MSVVYLSLGANQGDKLENIQIGLARLEQMGLVVERVSSVYETEPVGCGEQPMFLNCSARLHTSLNAAETLAALQAVEVMAGRRRSYPGAPRPLDLDILLFDQAVIDIPGLVVPHPRMVERRFVLEPLAEIAPDEVHPVLKKTIRALLRLCRDRHSVEFYCIWPGLPLKSGDVDFSKIPMVAHVI